MDTFECITTKLDVRAFSAEDVPVEVRWRFILVDNKQNLKTLAEDSTSGSWVRGANFAIIVLTNPEYNFHLIDAGRVAQNMQLLHLQIGLKPSRVLFISSDRITPK